MSETLFDTFPRGVDVDALVRGYELHKAASATLRSKADAYSSTDATKSSQRQAILDIAARLLVKDRNEAFDRFAQSWLKARGISVNSS